MIHSKIIALTGILSFGSAIQYHAHAHEHDNSSLPNIIIILTDDQGYGDLAAYGNTA